MHDRPARRAGPAGASDVREGLHPGGAEPEAGGRMAAARGARRAAGAALRTASVQGLRHAGEGRVKGRIRWEADAGRPTCTTPPPGIARRAGSAPSPTATAARPWCTPTWTPGG